MEFDRRNILARASFWEIADEYTRCMGIRLSPLKGDNPDAGAAQSSLQPNRLGRQKRMLSLIYLFAWLSKRLNASEYRSWVSPYSAALFLLSLLASMSVYGWIAQYPAPQQEFNSKQMIKVTHPIFRGLHAKANFDETESQPLPSYEYLGGDLPSELYPQIASAPPPLKLTQDCRGQDTWNFRLAAQPHAGEEAPGSSSDNDETTQVAQASKKPPQPLEEGVHYTIRSGDNLWLLAEANGIDYRKVLQYNPGVNPRRLQPGDEIYLPGVKDPYKKNNRMIMPVANAKVHSGYGLRKHPIGGGVRFHKGVDMAGRVGKPIIAALDGKVVYAGPEGALGYIVRLKHDRGLTTVYAHCSRLLVKSGQRVRQGDLIARVGRSGRVTGPHLHFEVWKNGKHVNPINYLPGGRYYIANR